MTLEQHITEIIERATKTFVEAYAAAMLITPVSGGKSAAVGGIGALISAVWTTAIKLEGGKATDLLTEAEDDAQHIFVDEDDDEDDDEVETDENGPELPAAGSKVAPGPPTPPQNIPVASAPANPLPPQGPSA